MPKTVLRQFTGGISNEIDAQNLREDQGEEAIDINLKGFALEPGDGISPMAAAKHYYYRGKWIKDSAAVSFEESGVGIVKTYDAQRPKFEEIINDEATTDERDLGPPLPPDATITGTIVSEGTRGEKTADGAHLLELPGTILNSIDTAATITDAPSLVEHKVTTTDIEDNIYYYSNQPYWVEKDGLNLKVKTRQFSGGEFQSGDYESGSLTHNSGGSFFKDNYFICWDEQYIDVVALSNSSMSINSFNTLDENQGGNQGASLGFSTSAVAKEISSVELCNGTLSFIQRIETADRKQYGDAEDPDDYAIEKYTNSDDERWILPRKNDAYLLLLRDGHPYEYGGNGSWSGGSVEKVIDSSYGDSVEADGAYNLGSDDVEIITNAGGKRAVEWITPKSNDPTGKWSQKYFNGESDIGIKYIVEYLPKGEWACVRQLGVNKPEILAIETKGSTLTSDDVKKVTVTRSFSETAVSPRVRTKYRADSGDSWQYSTYQNFRLNVSVDMRFPKISGSINWYGNPIPEKRMYWTDNSSHADNAVHPTGSAFGTHVRIFNSTRYISSPFIWGGAEGTNSPNRLTILDVEYSNQGGGEQGKRSRWVRSMNLDIRQNWKARAILYRIGSKGARGLAINSIIPPTHNAPADPYKNETIRLCSKPVDSGSIAEVSHGSQSTIHTVATIAKEDKSISFAEATATNFVEGDYIRVSTGYVKAGANTDKGEVRRISSNLPYLSSISSPSTSFIAMIKKDGMSLSGKLRLAPIPGFEERFMVGVDEECYPIISTIDTNIKETGESEIGEVPTQTRKLLRTDLSINTLLGCSHGRKYDHNEMGVGDKQSIEVRSKASVRHLQASDYAHQINWQDNTIRAVNVGGSGDPRIIYIKDGFLKSQNGSQSDVTARNPANKVVLSDKAKIYLTDSLMSVVDNDKIIVYDPLFGIKFTQSNLKKPDGLGIAEATKIVDVFHVDNLSVGTLVFIQIQNGDTVSWRMIKTGSEKSETSLLSYNFTKPIAFDGELAWGILKKSNGAYDIHTTVPFFESEIDGSWINYSSEGTNDESAWGEVLKTRIASASGDSTNNRWMSIAWRYDSGLKAGSTPVIGLAHEADKMIGADNEFTWYPKDAPDTFHDTGTEEGFIIDKPKIAIKFKSAVTRDIVFFKPEESSLPAGGSTGFENRVTFNNYAIDAQYFYVLNSQAIELMGDVDTVEKGYRMGQAKKLDNDNKAFDASRVGISSFLIGAPNMYNPYGPNIDFYYRASFIDKWKHESVPSKVSSEGIMPLDSADDCIQLNFPITFFRFNNPYIEKIRLYRYGGDSSEFMFLRDIDMPSANLPLALQKSTAPVGEFYGDLEIKEAGSSFYNLNTFFDISVLSTLTNSSFTLTALPALGWPSAASDIDGSWRVNQINEAPLLTSSTTPPFRPAMTGNFGDEGVNTISLASGHGSALLTSGVITAGMFVESSTANVLAVGTTVQSVASDNTITILPVSGSGADGGVNGVPLTFTSGTRAKLGADLTIDATTITLDDDASILAYDIVVPAVVKIEEEYIRYTDTGYPSTNTLTGCVRGVYGSKASTHSSEVTTSGGSAPLVTVVEWELEMEHRNQDTTTLDGEISSTVPAIIKVKNTDIFDDEGTLKIGNHLINYTGKSLDGLTFTGCSHNNTGGDAVKHSDGVTVFSHNETFTETRYRDIQIEVDEFGYRDKARTPIMSLHSMKEDNWPPLPIEYNDKKKEFYAPEVQEDFFRYITSVGSLYFASVDADLRFSRFGSPEYWPLEAVVTLDSEIKGIMEHAGEGIVFTTNSVYRVRGTDPKAMVAFRVPDAKGIMDGDRHSIAEFNGGIIWKTASDGLCMYSGGRVSYITRDKQKIPILHMPYSCVSDGSYWLFQRPKAVREEGDTGNGFRLDITSGDMRLCQTTIQAYYAYYAKALGKAIVVTSDNSLTPTSGITHTEDFVAEEIGGTKISNLSWRSKKIDVGEPAVAKAFGSVAIVYESLASQTSLTADNGIRGEALAVYLLGLNANELEAGDLNESALDSEVDLYDVFTKYNSVGQEFIADIGGTNWGAEQRKTILMPVGFDTNTVNAGDSIWNELFDDNTKVKSVNTTASHDVVASDGSSDLLFTDIDHIMQDGDEIQFTTTGTLPGNIAVNTNYYVNDKEDDTFKVETVVDGGNVQYSSTAGSGVSYNRTNPSIVLDKEPLRSGDGNIVWGNLPKVHIYINNESIPARSFTLPPIVSEEPQSADLYLEDLRRFRTISVQVEGNFRVNTISLRHFPVQQFQSQTLHHSADIFYKGIVDFRVKLDGDLIYRKELTNAGKEFTEERIYLPASSFGSRVHYMNESRNGMIESVTFNGALAA